MPLHVHVVGHKDRNVLSKNELSSLNYLFSCAWIIKKLNSLVYLHSCLRVINANQTLVWHISRSDSSGRQLWNSWSRPGSWKRVVFGLFQTGKICMSVHIEAHNLKVSVFVSCEENCLHFTLLKQVNYTAVGLELPKIITCLNIWIKTFVFSSPEHKGLTVSFCDGQLPVVHHPCVRPCVNNFFIQLLLCIRLLDFDLTSQEWFRCGPLPTLLK